MATFSATRSRNVAVAVATVAVIALSTWVSLNPKFYYFRSSADQAAWSHPTGHFLVVCALYIAEAALLAWSVRGGRRLWPRTGVVAVVFAPWAAFSSMFVVHAPGFLHVHLLWTWLVLAVLLLVTLGSGTRHLLDRVRGASNAA
jgi:hypothetical protein